MLPDLIPSDSLLENIKEQEVSWARQDTIYFGEIDSTKTGYWAVAAVGGGMPHGLGFQVQKCSTKCSYGIFEQGKLEVGHRIEGGKINEVYPSSTS